METIQCEEKKEKRLNKNEPQKSISQKQAYQERREREKKLGKNNCRDLHKLKLIKNH